MIDRILRPYREFCRAYVDDIVIFSTSLNEHIKHLNLVFRVLDNMNIYLSPKKSFLSYSLVYLFGQKVDALGLTTAEEKLTAIFNLAFPRTLSQLEKYLGITGYLRQYISNYAAIARSLQERKTFLTKTISVGGNARKKATAHTHLTMPTPKELNSFHQLQKLFSSPSILHHHDEKRILYFDDDEKGLRLCIPSALEAEVFKLAYDEMGHSGYARTHERLTEGLYISGMATKLHEFIRHCSNCQLNQTPRHMPHGSLQPIYSPSRPFHTLTIDFILALSTSASPDEFDCIISVTDKFSKAVTYLSGKIIWSAKEWANALLDRLSQLI